MCACTFEILASDPVGADHARGATRALFAEAVLREQANIDIGRHLFCTERGVIDQYIVPAVCAALIFFLFDE